MDSPGVLDNLKSGVLGAVKGALVPGSSAEEDTRNKAGTAAEGGAAEQEEEEQQQEQQEEEESRGKMIAMAIATISK